MSLQTDVYVVTNGRICIFNNIYVRFLKDADARWQGCAHACLCRRHFSLMV